MTYGTETVSALGYARVSTADQAENGYSLDAQERAIRALCKERGWNLEQVYQDAASGKDRKRPGLQELLRDLRRGDVFVVAKLDRLSRSISDFSYVLERSKREGWSLVIIDFGLDLTTPNGELVANLLMALAQWERHVISQRTREGIAEKRARGEKITGRSERAPAWVMEKIHQLYGSGLTMKEVAAHLAADGIPTSQGGKWSQGQVWFLLDREKKERAEAS